MRNSLLTASDGPATVISETTITYELTLGWADGLLRQTVMGDICLTLGGTFRKGATII